MHYYKRNIGDYHRKAGRLTMLQHGAYTLIMDSCYDREQFPTREQAIDWCWASTPEEIAAVDFVLSKFFILSGDVFVQGRINDELERYHGNAETNRRIALEREENRRNRARIENEHNTDRARQDDEPPPNQEPRTTNQEPETKKSSTARGTRLPADWQLTDELKAIAKQIRTDWHDSHVQRIADGFKDYWLAKSGKDATKADWVATWRNWCRNDKSAVWPSPQGPAPSAPTRASHKPMPTLPPRKPRPEGLDLG